MRLFKLEAIRGFAAFYVVLHHTAFSHFKLSSGVEGYLLRFGHEAVILFFLLSGFVVNYSFRRSEDQSFRTYFLRRFTRIYIPLVFVFVLGYLVQSARNGSPVDPNWPTLLGNLLMLQNFSGWGQSVIVDPYLYNLPLWSLSLEWWFYMLYFPLASRIHRSNQRARLVFVTAVMAACVYIVLPAFMVRIFMYLGLWWCGVIVSELVLEGKKVDFRAMREPMFALAAINLALLVNIWLQIDDLPSRVSRHPFLELRHFAFASLVIPLAILWQRAGWIGFDLFFKPFAWLAPISYAIYISHFYIVRSAHYLDFIGNRYAEYLGYLLVLILFSAVLEKKIYPPLRRRVFALASSGRRFVRSET